jgi:hypothetical protein
MTARPEGNGAVPQGSSGLGKPVILFIDSKETNQIGNALILQIILT